MRLDADQHAGEEFAERERDDDAEDAAQGDESRGLCDDEADGLRRDAPSARRIPISCVRCETE